MSTAPLFRSQPYQRENTTRVISSDPEGGIVVADAVFYPAGGGQPGDTGWLDWDGGRLAITDTRKAEGGLALIPEPGAPMPPVGSDVALVLDWDRRHLHMRVHTALHLLSVVMPFPVTGGQIGAGKGRLDFDLPDAPEDKAAIEAALNALIARDLAVTESWITDAELAANPGLVKTMSVQPPTGQGRVRLIRIGSGADQVDLQPCGGTHVARTAEIGPVTLGKIEKKGRQNRRVSLHLSGFAP
jgi:misacylated tRNA(Ala) deacylase